MKKTPDVYVSTVRYLKKNMHLNPVITKHFYNIRILLDQRRRRCADFVQMLTKCFVFAGEVNEMNRALGHLCAHIG